MTCVVVLPQVEWATFFAMAFLCPVVVPFIINRMSKQDFKKKSA